MQIDVLPFFTLPVVIPDEEILAVRFLFFDTTMAERDIPRSNCD